MTKEELQKAADAAGFCTSNYGIGQALKAILQHEADKMADQKDKSNDSKGGEPK